MQFPMPCAPNLTAMPWISTVRCAGREQGRDFTEYAAENYFDGSPPRRSERHTHPSSDGQSAGWSSHARVLSLAVQGS